MIENAFSGGYIRLSSVAVTTPPTKTAYTTGESFDPTGMVVTATYSNGATKIAAGYTITPDPLTMGTTAVTITYSEGGVTRTATQAVTVNKVQVTVPTVSGTLTYSGSEQSPTISNEPSTDIATRGGTTSATNAGSYTKTYTLIDTTNYEWATSWDGNLTWSIGKAAPSLTLSANSATVNIFSKTITITTNSDGALSASSNKTNIATASLDGDTLTITGVANGSATITVSLAEGTNYLSASATVSVTVNLSPVELIPAMTSNTTPSGTCSCKDVQNGTAWGPFRSHSVTDMNTRRWLSKTKPSWLRYDFPEDVVVTSVWLSTLGNSVNGYEVKNFKLQYSLDEGSTWLDATNTLTFATKETGNKLEQSYAVNSIRARCWRWYVTACAYTNENYIRIICTQLYGYQTE